jgi:hypothetical protein
MHLQVERGPQKEPKIWQQSEPYYGFGSGFRFRAGDPYIFIIPRAIQKRDML